MIQSADVETLPHDFGLYGRVASPGGHAFAGLPGVTSNEAADTTASTAEK
jgi:hypothetical protein